MSTKYSGTPALEPTSIPGHPTPGTALPEPKSRNTVGIIALICAALGFIFACIPGWLILGWILLPFGFILGIIGLFMKAKKATAIAAIVVSILGTVAAVFVFTSVVGQAFEENFNQEVSVSQEGVSDADAATALPAGSENASGAGTSRSNPLPVGATVENSDWAVTLNNVDLDATGEVLAENPFNEEPGPDQTYILANVTLTYKGNDPQGSAPMAIIEYVTADGTTVNYYDHSSVTPDQLDDSSSLYNGGSTTGNQAFLVPVSTAGDGVIAIQPDLFSEKAFFAVK